MDKGAGLQRRRWNPQLHNDPRRDCKAQDWGGFQIAYHCIRLHIIALNYTRFLHPFHPPAAMTINFELRDRADKSGLRALRVIIQDRGKRVFVPLAVKLLKTDWDAKTQRVKSSHPKAGVINNVLSLKLAELQGKVATESLAGNVDLESVAGRRVSKTPFGIFATYCLKRWEKTKAPSSIRAYFSMYLQAMAYDPGVAVESITPDWLARYEDHCRSECGDGGTLKRIAFISVILKEAIRQGIIDRDPFLIYRKPPKKNPPKVWLTMEELGSIEKVARENGSEVVRKTAWWFLFACYTGLRYSDVAAFTPAMVQSGRLILYTQKTGEVVSIKLTGKIKELMGKIKKQGKVYSNQKINQYLKSVAHLAKVKKLLTFHTARHTFAVNCANLGISQEVAAKLLGHSDLKTTALYYKIIDQRVDQEMKKWERH